MPKAVSPTRLSTYQKLKAQIVGGVLRPGDLLPSTRSLANEQGISRMTVVAAYEQLAAEGYIQTKPGSRSRVSLDLATHHLSRTAPPVTPTHLPRLSSFGQRIADLALPQPPAIKSVRTDINFLYGALSTQDFPRLAWRRTYNQLLLQKQEHDYYVPPEGLIELRREVQGYLLRARGLLCSPEQILIVHGSQQAIDLCARVLIDPGNSVVIEEPCYLMARRAFEAAGAKLTAIPVDEQGLVTEHLPNKKTVLAYVTPSHQFPLGAVMSIGRRQELLAWASRNAAWVVEDDYDGEFRYGLSPVDTLQSLDQAGTVIYVGTFSKALSPQMRLGYLVLPMSLVGSFRRAKQLNDRHAPRLEQAVLASLLRGGVYERHIRRIRRSYEKRRSALITAIEQHLPSGTYIEGAASGLHVVLWLDWISVKDEAKLVSLAREHRVGVWPISPLYGAGRSMRLRNCAGLVVGYASLSLPDIDTGIRRLAKVIAQNFQASK